MNYQEPRSTVDYVQTLSGKFAGGKMNPVMAIPVRGSESGVLNQTVDFTLDQVAGRMITPVTAHVTSVFVPVQALHALKHPDEAFAGSEEMIRQELLEGNPLFGLEDETELTQRMGIVPRSIGGEKKVNEMARLGHNCAVNFLRRKLYVKATQLDASNDSVTPSLYSSTALARYNAVLDPDDHVNGSVELQLGSVKLPVKGLGIPPSRMDLKHTSTMRSSDGEHNSTDERYRWDTMVADIAADGLHPDVYVDQGGGTAGNISLQDFYRAEKMDMITRKMRRLVDENPEYGEEMVAKFAHGLDVDVNRQPIVLYDREIIFSARPLRATNGPDLGQIETELLNSIPFTTIVPKTQFGGIVITFAQVKPDEAIQSQPHPVLSEEWGAINFAADDLKLDPVPVYVRDLDAECDPDDENQVAFYTGHNEVKVRYTNYGFTRNTNPDDVENKTALWQVLVPVSVTPENIVYDEDLDHYPFGDQFAEVCTYVITSSFRATSPIIKGPTPVEKLAAIDRNDIFEGEEA